VLEIFSKPLPVGSRAPDFTLVDQDGRPITLSNLRGSFVMLVFYPGDETPVCRSQLCELRDRSDLLAAAGVKVFGINPQNAESHRKFGERHHFGFPLLVDRNQEVARLYRAKWLMTIRTVYLIDADGIIRFARRGKPSPEEVLQAAGVTV
jgi:thioredoxin-dependent peroxiredoxin